MRLEWIVKTPSGKVGITNVHCPPKATLSETGAITKKWGDMTPMRSASQVLFGGP